MRKIKIYSFYDNSRIEVKDNEYDDDVIFFVISDIHGNFKNLNLTIEKINNIAANEKKEQVILCLGDIFEQRNGPPEYELKKDECIEKIKTIKNILSIKGNHDHKYNSKDIKKENKKYINNLPYKILLELNHREHGKIYVAMVHSNFKRDISWDYIPYKKELYKFKEHFFFFSRFNRIFDIDSFCQIGFYGHTHSPDFSYSYYNGDFYNMNKKIKSIFYDKSSYTDNSTYTDNSAYVYPFIDNNYKFDKYRSAIFNPGSIGITIDNNDYTFLLFEPKEIKFTWIKI